MKKILILLAAASLSIVACKKEKPQEPRLKMDRSKYIMPPTKTDTIIFSQISH